MAVPKFKVGDQVIWSNDQRDIMEITRIGGSYADGITRYSTKRVGSIAPGSTYDDLLENYMTPYKILEEKKQEKVSGLPTFNVSIDKISTDFMETTVKKVLDSQASVYTAELQKRLQPSIIKIDSKEILIDKTKHYMFKDVLYKCMVHKQVFLSGPTGSGKTTLAAQIAESMNIPFYFISCSAGMSEAHLLGRMLFDGSYASSDLVRAYEEGGIFLFDEIDAADNNTLLVINSAIANNRLSIPNRKNKPYAERHANFVCIVAGNSWGEGSIQYQGRSPLDRAFLDRFALQKVHIDYDADLEKLITAKQPTVAKIFHEFRGHLKSKSIDKPISTRTIISAYKDMENSYTIKDILKQFIVGWSIDEIKQAEIFINKY